MTWMTLIQKMRTAPSTPGNGAGRSLRASFGSALEEAYLQLLLTSTVGGVFDAAMPEELPGVRRLHRAMAGEDAEFVAQAVLYAVDRAIDPRMPVHGLAALAAEDRDLFLAVFPGVVRTPADLAEFLEALDLPFTANRVDRTVRRAVVEWLAELSEDAAIRAAGTPAAAALRRAIRVTEPRPVNRTQEAIFAWLRDSSAWAALPERTFTPQIAALEALKEMAFVHGGRDHVLDLIAEGRLPFEVVSRVVTPDADTWTGLMYSMPYRDLVGHLGVFHALGILGQPSNAAYAGRRLTNTDALRRSRLMPVDLFTTLSGFRAENRAESYVVEALTEAIEMSFINLPFVGGRVAVAPDVSSSMLGVMSYRQGVTHTIDVAGVLTGALLRANPEALVLPFNDRVMVARFSPRDGVLEVAARLAELCRGQANLAEPLTYLLDNGIAVDSFIGITDHGPWVTGDLGSPVALLWEEYRAHVAPNARAFLVALAPGRVERRIDDAVAAWARDVDLHLIQGWSSQALHFIEMMVDGLEHHLDAVGRIEIA